jgi:hypothetical protein
MEFRKQDVQNAAQLAVSFNLARATSDCGRQTSLQLISYPSDLRTDQRQTIQLGIIDSALDLTAIALW